MFATLHPLTLPAWPVTLLMIKGLRGWSLFVGLRLVVFPSWCWSVDDQGKEGCS